MPDVRYDAAMAALTADLLRQGRGLDLLSLGLLLVSVGGLLGGIGDAPGVSLGASAAAGLVQRYLAFRCALDARVFARWGATWAQSGAAPGDDMAAFDAALAQLTGRAVAGSLRPVAQRAAGALRLLRHQLAALLVQLAGLIAAIVLRLLSTG